MSRFVVLGMMIKKRRRHISILGTWYLVCIKRLPARQKKNRIEKKIAHLNQAAKEASTEPRRRYRGRTIPFPEFHAL